MSKLYELADEYAASFAAVNYNADTGEIEGWDKFEGVSADFDDKVEATACWIKNLRMEADGIAAEIDSLKKRHTAKVKKIEWAERYLSSALNAVGRDQFETPRCAIGFRKSTRILVFDEGRLDDKYVTEKIERKPNREAIKKALTAGISVEGAELEVRHNIQIK